MISLKINKVPTLFIKAFTAADVQQILDFVRAAAVYHSGRGNDVLFIDTPITSYTVEAVGKLCSEEYRVAFRDHHGIDGEPSNSREKQVTVSTAKLQHLLGDDCRITIRRLHPACSTLVSIGEFADAVAIIADPDADGLTAAMKAAGIYYEGLDDDAAKLDGEPQLQVTGTPISQLLAKGMATIPSYDSKKPKEREIAQQKLFSDWVSAVSGDESAKLRLEEKALLYNQASEASRKIADAAVAVAPGVVLVDAGNKLFDPGTLHAVLESDPERRIIVVRKTLGPIAALHGVQYSLAVVKRYQDSTNLQKLLAADSISNPEVGVISNVSFLLHVSEEVWKSTILPGLIKQSW
jgi:hypothetical protein